MMRPDNITYSERGRAEALDEITKISFAIDELRLYLDTHPNCTEALHMIQEYIGQRQTMMNNFTEKYGSLRGYCIGNGDTWTWNAGYMPWSTGEGGC